MLAPASLRRAPLAVGLLACLAFAAAELAAAGRPAFPLDDSWIHLEFARHLAAGDGLSFEPPRRVAGSTAPLWTALVSLGFLPGLDPVVWAKLLGVACLLLAVAATRRLAAALGLAPGLAVLAAALTAATGWLVWGALSGLEICLFTFLSLAGLERRLHERGGERVGLGLPLLGLAVLARPEGLVLLAAALADGLLAARGRAGRRALAGGAAVALAVILPAALAFIAIGGSPLPTTFAAKSGGLAAGGPDGRHLATALTILFGAQPLLTLAAGGGVLALAARLGTARDRGLLPALWLLGLPLAQSFLASPAGPLVGNFGRYLFPLLPVVVVLGLLGGEGLAARLAALAPAPRRAATAALLATLGVPAAVELASAGERYALSVRNVEASDVAMARWLREWLPPAALVAAHDVGALGYHLDNPLLDLAGIVDGGARAAMARSEAAGEGWAAGLLAFLEARRADYLVVFPRYLPFLARPELSFRLIRELEIADNITMGDDRLALYATPWCRYPPAAAEAAR